jgi:hypothetical protein
MESWHGVHHVHPLTADLSMALPKKLISAMLIQQRTNLMQQSTMGLVADYSHLLLNVNDEYQNIYNIYNVFTLQNIA